MPQSQISPSEVIPGATEIRDWDHSVGGSTEIFRQNNLLAQRAPAATDDQNQGFHRGSVWIYGGTVYTCTDSQPGAAVWQSNLTIPGYAPLAQALSVITAGVWQYKYPFVIIPSNSVQLGNSQLPIGAGPWINGFYYVEGSSAKGLTSLQFNDLAGIYGNFYISNAASLGTISCPALKILTGNLDSGNISSLATLNVPNLVVIGGALVVNFFSSLFTSFSFPSLVAVGGNFGVFSGGLNLTSINFPNLSSVGGNFFAISGTTNCPTYSFPSLQYIGGNFTPSMGTAALTITLPTMVQYSGSISISSATNLSFLVLGTIGTLKFIPGNITLSGLKLNAASVNALLALLVSLDGTNGTTLWGTGKALTINGGTNAAPSGQGITDKATLVGRGATITTN
jgi:hypothetical protein